MKLHLPHRLRLLLLSALFASVGSPLYSASFSSSGGDDTVSLTIHTSQDSGSLAHRTMVLENSLAGSLNSGASSLVQTNSAGIIPVPESSAQTGTPSAVSAELVTTVSPSPQQPVVATTAISTPQIAALSFPTPVYPAPLALSAAETSTVAYTPPSEITIPAGYTEVLVDDVSDIAAYSSSATDVAFLLTADVTVDGRPSALMTSSADSWYFTSNSVDNLRSLTFSNATASLFGVNNYEKLEFNGLKSVTFSGNTADYGGAIRGYSNSTIRLSGNGSVMFSGNTASFNYDFANGGAICGQGSTTELSGNGSVTFSGNTASSNYDYAYGGAICDSTIELSGNGSVMFSGNTASASSSSSANAYAYAYGGAIYGSTITLADNESVTFSENTASSSYYAYGGAILGYGNLNIRNNDSVLFEKNAEVRNETYRLRSIYAGGSGDVISLSAAAGKSIEFRDSVYIDSGSTVNLNADYTDANGVVHKQTGDIIFTGKYTEQHLNELLAADGLSRSATAKEIRNSRTTEVNAMTNLYGGRLRVEDGAVYMGYGITAMEDSAATVLVKAATLNHAGYDLTFNSYTSLELVGDNVISGNVRMQEASTLRFDIGETAGVSMLSGNLTFVEGAHILVYSDGNRVVENEILLYMKEGTLSGWDTDSLTVQNGVDGNAADIRWINGDLLVLNYNAENFKPYFRGDIAYTTRQTGDVHLKYYNSVSFANLTSSSGGAIYGNDGSTIELSGNGSVTFSGNTASYGGAIYGYGSTIELSGNGSVTFSGNTASSAGGAIYGPGNSTITLRDNGSVTFSGNTASSSSYASGGAIYGGSNSTIELSGNGSVTFSGNTASYVGGAIDGGNNSTIELSGNGSVTFIGNTASSSGGAIYGGDSGTITLSGNDSVTFIGNTASYGGAIRGDGNLNIRNNDSVLFEKNAEVQNETYRLRSIYAGGSGDVISLSAAAGKSIEFRDSVYIASGSTVNLNADYTDANGVVHKQTGDIIFTGKYTEQHLNEQLAADGAERTATEAEIPNSRTTVVNAMTNLYGGRLRVEDGAVYKGYGITAHEGSSATVLVKDATLNHAGYDLSFRSGTTLELVGDNVISGNVRMHAGSTLTFDMTADPGYTTHYGGLSIDDDTSIRILLKPETWDEERGALKTIILLESNDASLTGVTHANTIATVSGLWVYKNAEWSDGQLKVLCKNGAVNATWTNESGDGRWNHTSLNWVDDGFRVADVDGANIILGAEAAGNILLEEEIAIGNMTVRGNSSYALEYGAGAGLMMSGDLKLETGSSLTTGGGIVAASVLNDGALEVAGNLEVQQQVRGEGVLRVDASLSAAGLLLTDEQATHSIGGAVTIGGAVAVDGSLSAVGSLSGTVVTVGGALSAASLTADSLSAASLRLTDTAASNTVKEAVSVSGAVDVAGSLSAGGSLSGTAVTVGGALSAASLTADSLSAASLELTAADAANSVVGDLTADAVSLASGASLEVGGTLTAAEVLIHGPAKVLQAGAFGAETMNFVLDRAALESLNLSGGDTGTIARANTAMGSGFTATLNGGTMPVQAAAYVYDISVNGGAVQLTADYAHNGMQVWSSGKWVGQSGWTDFYIAGYDAVNGVETVDLGGDTVQGANLFIAYEDDVRSSVVKNGKLEFDYVDMGGGQFELGENATMTTDELYGKGETLVMHRDSVLNATELTLGTLALEGGELTVKKATINAMSGTEGTLNIESNGRVTVKSDVTLTGLENLGNLNLGKNTLTVNALVDVGGDVTAGEVAVQSRGSFMAIFDKLVADKVTVVNNIPAGRYTDDLSVGDGSAIGELVAEMLEVREGVVTLGRTDAATEQVLKALDLQEDAALVLNQRTALTVTDELSATEGAELRLKQQASVSYGDMNISNRGAAAQVVVNAYDLANDSIQELSHAHVAVSGSEDRSIDYKLTNSSVENTGSGKLYLTHAENTFSSISADTGDIAVMNQALELNLDELVVGEGVSFSAYQGETELPEQEAVVSVSQSVSFGAGAHINADLKLRSGVRVEMNGPVSMGSDLYLEHGMTLGGAMLETLTSTEQGQTVVLFSGIDRLYLSGEEQTDAITLSHGVSASEYFVNLISSQERSYYLVYDNELPGEGVLSIAVSGLAVPEPTSSMLGLMGLVAFTLRRRRK